MKRYLLLGRTDADVRVLEIDAKGRHLVQHMQVPVRIYVEMPVGYTGPTKGFTVNANFAPLSLEVEPGQWLTIVPESKLPPSEVVMTIPPL